MKEYKAVDSFNPGDGTIVFTVEIPKRKSLPVSGEQVKINSKVYSVMTADRISKEYVNLRVKENAGQ